MLGCFCISFWHAGKKREEGCWQVGSRQGQASKNGSPSLPQVKVTPKLLASKLGALSLTEVKTGHQGGSELVYRLYFFTRCTFDMPQASCTRANPRRVKLKFLLITDYMKTANIVLKTIARFAMGFYLSCPS